MQINSEAEIAELASRLNLKYDTMNINVNTPVTGYAPFTYKGSNGTSIKKMLAVFPKSPDNTSNWVFSVSTRVSGGNNMIDVYANGSATIPVFYLYIDV